MNKRLFVAGLPFSTTESELKDLFGSVGSVVSASIIIDRMTSKSKGFGFVEMETEEEAGNAVSKLNNTDFGGRKLVVAEAKPMEDREKSGRSGEYRGHSQGGYSGQRRSFGPRQGGSRGNFGKRRGGNSHGHGSRDSRY